ncbi:MAG: hypothetical protein SGPRY_012955 [Prymnesium sp.]
MEHSAGAEVAYASRESSRAKEESAFVDLIWDAPSGCLPEHSPGFRGFLCNSWLGLRHQLYDSGRTPQQPVLFPRRRQRELAAIMYEPNVMKSRPNSMMIVLPHDESGGAEYSRSQAVQ